MNIKFKKKFIKNFDKLDNNIQRKVSVKIDIFRKNYFDRTLNNHTLTWEYLWCRSINITWDYRVIFKEYPEWTYEFVDFIDIWTHSKLY